MNRPRRPGIRPSRKGPNRFPDWAPGAGQAGFGRTRPDKMNARLAGGFLLARAFYSPNGVFWVGEIHTEEGHRKTVVFS